MAEFIAVSKDDFFNFVGPLDVTVTPVGNYPYRTEFKLRSGKLVGYEDRDGQFYTLPKEAWDRKEGGKR